MRVILLEVSHWHFPLYQEALRQADIEVVGVSDTQAAYRDRAAAYFDCPAYANHADLVREPADFAFVFGRHADMPTIASSLIERGIPFAIEKPGGVTADDVATLRRKAEERNLYVAVPFVQRISPLLEEIRRIQGSDRADYGHLSFRFIAGPPSRYLDKGSPWMLDPALSGGGCTINLAVHFIDLVRLITGAEVDSVYARMSRRIHNTPVEDYSLVALTLSDGAVATIETGYSFPMAEGEQREFTFSLSSSSHYLRATDEGLRVTPRGPAGGAPIDKELSLETDDLYAIFVQRVLSDLRAGTPPVAGLGDLEAVMRVVDASYASADTGRAIRLRNWFRT